MKRRDFIKCIGASGIAMSAPGCLTAEPAQRSAMPNIVLCMADDQGWGDMAYNGHPLLKTPNFDRMAEESLRFDRFYAAAPVCSPTRGSVMTGRHPNRFGCFKWGHTLRPQEITVAELLRNAGYATGHFGKWHLGSVQKGSPVNPGASGFDEWFSAPNFFDNDPVLSREGVAVQTRGESSIVTADAAMEFIAKHARSSRPFLAVVWFGSPHSPHRAAEEDRKLYAGQKKPDFLGEITGMDRALGRLRDGLKDLGVHENTVLWYCSDNGGLDAGTSGGRGKKGSIYEGGLRVPAILEWPERIKSPAVTDVPCNTSDILPSLLEIAGVRWRNTRPLDGISLVPVIDQKMRARPAPMGFWDHPTGGVKTPSAAWMGDLLKAQKEGKETVDQSRLRLNAGKIAGKHPEDRFPGHAAWLDWPWKLHRIQASSGAPRFELYDLSADPNEERDRGAEERDRLKSMNAQLEEWLVSVVRSLNGSDYK